MFTREVVARTDGRYAVVRFQNPRAIERAEFALPPDSAPTGRLWARLERELAEWL